MDPVSFIGGVVVAAGTWHTARKMQRHKAPKEGLGDLLGWAFLIDEGIILMKDGTFLAGMTLRGRDLESASHGEINRATQTIHDAIALLGEGWAIEVNIHRRERREYPDAKHNHFPAKALDQVEKERSNQFLEHGEHYETVNFILLSYIPPRDNLRRWERVVVSGDESSMDYTHTLEQFIRSFEEVRTHLESSFFVRSLDSQALLTQCHWCLTGLDDAVAIQHGYLSHTLASSDFVTGYIPHIAGEHTYVLTISSLGSFTRAASGDFFNGLREEARWHMRFVTLSRAKAQHRIRKLQNKWFHQRGGLRALASYDSGNRLEDQDAVAMERETASVLAESTSGHAHFGYFSNTILIRDADLQSGKARAQAMLQVLRNQGFTCSLETINATDAFIGSLPGHGHCNLRRPLLSSRNVAHLFPVTTPWRGQSSCPNPFMPPGSPPLLYARAYGATPFYVNLHQEDVGHTLVIGATGAGKSVLSGFLGLSFLRYKNSRVFLFDIGGSHRVLTRAAEGVHLPLGKKKTPALQPLRFLDTPADRMWASAWLQTIFDLSGRTLSPSDRKSIDHTLSLLAKAPMDQRTLTALHSCLPITLQDAIEPFTVKGAYGELMDGINPEPPALRMTTWELGAILPLGDIVVAPLLLALFAQIERSLDGRPTLIIIEEAWAALMRSTFSSRIRQWLLTLRKHNAAVVIVAHSAAQLRSLPDAASIAESCPTRILLPNPEARVPEHAEVYHFLDLGTREIDLIASAQRRREYYYKSPAGSRLFELNLGPMARALLMPLPGKTPQESAKEIDRLIDRYGSSFLDHIDR